MNLLITPQELSDKKIIEFVENGINFYINLRKLIKENKKVFVRTQINNSSEYIIVLNWYK